MAMENTGFPASSSKTWWDTVVMEGSAGSSESPSSMPLPDDGRLKQDICLRLTGAGAHKAVRSGPDLRKTKAGPNRSVCNYSEPLKTECARFQFYNWTALVVSEWKTVTSHGWVCFRSGVLAVSGGGAELRMAAKRVVGGGLREVKGRLAWSEGLGLGF